VACAYLGLGLASIATLSVPPLGTSGVDDMTSSTIDRDVGTRDGDQWTFPLFVSERSRALEGNLLTVRRTSSLQYW
jgi:hypothetical protein